jgi:hypothetical protein
MQSDPDGLARGSPAGHFAQGSSDFSRGKKERLAPLLLHHRRRPVRPPDRRDGRRTPNDFRSAAADIFSAASGTQLLKIFFHFLRPNAKYMLTNFFACVNSKIIKSFIDG